MGTDTVVERVSENITKDKVADYRIREPHSARDVSPSYCHLDGSAMFIQSNI